MPELVRTSAQIYNEIGPVAFLIICGALTFGWLVWRIVVAQDKISNTLDKVNGILSSHDQRAADMYATCREHGTQLAKINDTLGEHTAQIKVLQEVVRQ